MSQRLRKALADAGGSATIIFSESGVDTKTPHTAGHFDWEAVRSASTIGEGLLVALGRTTTFISRRNFESDAEYTRALTMIGDKLGPRAKLSVR